MIIYTMPSGDIVHRYDRSIVVKFSGKRSVISTCHLNGGYREDLTAVYNTNSNFGDCKCDMRESTYVERMKALTRELGLDVERTAVMATAVCMDNAVIKTMEYNGLFVTAIVTGGIENNGGRAGDPASFFEQDGKAIPINGTINIILEVNARMPSHALARCIITLTEAKTAAIQELMLGSCYSTGIATGSGTDQVIVYCNDQSDLSIVYTGKHSKAGELIGKVVKEAVKEALYRHQGASPTSQHSILKRLKRYGISEDKLWETYANKNHPTAINKLDFIDKVHQIDRMNEIVTLTSLYIHLLDQLGWGLISDDEARWAGNIILAQIYSLLNLDGDHKIEHSGDAINTMLDAYINVVTLGALNRAGTIEKH